MNSQNFLVETTLIRPCANIQDHTFNNVHCTGRQYLYPQRNKVHKSAFCIISSTVIFFMPLEIVFQMRPWAVFLTIVVMVEHASQRGTFPTCPTPAGKICLVFKFWVLGLIRSLWIKAHKVPRNAKELSFIFKRNEPCKAGSKTFNPYIRY